MTKKQTSTRNGAQLLVECLEKHNIPYLFGIPGTAVLSTFDACVDGGPKIIQCRHEQNAAFIAQAWGRITGNPGVCIATAGPGATNLTTGIQAAQADRDPMIAITGQVPKTQVFRNVHQNIDAVSLFAPITKWSMEIPSADTIPEAMANAFRIAATPREGAVHISFPMDVAEETTKVKPLAELGQVEYGVTSEENRKRVAEMINVAENPVVLLGVSSSKQKVTVAVRRFLEKTQLPTVGTFQAAGTVSHGLVHLFVGRVGVKSKEAGDIVLEKADLIITIGYDPVEYDPRYWNTSAKADIIHIDEIRPSVDAQYEPDVEVIGDIAYNLDAITEMTDRRSSMHTAMKAAQKSILKEQRRGATLSGRPIHPLRLIHDMQKTIGDDVIVVSDVGCHQLWLARYFYSYEPRHLLFSMGSQTMGVALPWAIGAALARPGTRILSNSGDGSFMMSSMELETAVRLKLPIVHIIWKDGTYNLIRIQQMQKYGRPSGIDLGDIDFVSFAKSFGANGLRVTGPTQIASTIRKAMKMKGPVVIEIPMDYRDNGKLIEGVEQKLLK